MNSRRHYKKIFKQEFENFLHSISLFIEFPPQFYLFDWEEKNGKLMRVDKTINEYGYFIGLNDNICLKIYSSIEKDDDTGRRAGEDAIRVVVAETDNAKPIRPAFKKIYRDGNWKEHFRTRVTEALKSLGMNVACPKCSSVLFLWRNTKTDERFLSCSKRPDCKYTRTFKLLT